MILRDEEQLSLKTEHWNISCELLSKIIIFVTRNNWVYVNHNRPTVVNCFQKLLSSWRGTTLFSKEQQKIQLWIAFKNYYLRDEEQLEALEEIIEEGCELLSKIIIFVTRNNVIKQNPSKWLVVNCFQKLLSSWRGTTLIWNEHLSGLLWIAFKNYYLRDEEQRGWWFFETQRSCELLSKIIIFVTRNNDSVV